MITSPGTEALKNELLFPLKHTHNHTLLPPDPWSNLSLFLGPRTHYNPGENTKELQDFVIIHVETEGKMYKSEF